MTNNAIAQIKLLLNRIENLEAERSELQEQINECTPAQSKMHLYHIGKLEAEKSELQEQINGCKLRINALLDGAE